MSANALGMKSSELVSLAWSLLLQKSVVPTEFHEQVSKVKEMLTSDSSGLIDSLTDFMISAALVNYKIETSVHDDGLLEILAKWLENINDEYRGQGIQVGVRGLAKEYFYERWKNSSFPILKITKWDDISNVTVPTSLFFVDGGSIYAKDKSSDNLLHPINYEYFIGKETDIKNKLFGKSVIITKPFTRLCEKYPIPFLVKRGIYQNWKAMDLLKNKQQQTIERVIPYLLLVKKSTEMLLAQQIKAYSPEELKQVVSELQDIQEKIDIVTSSVSGQEKAPVRATNADEEMEHFIPDLSKILNPSLFEEHERAILSGLGFIDIAEGTSNSRQQSILNPKPFIDEIQCGINDFKNILKDLVALIKINNKENHKKYVNVETYITSSPIRAFTTDDFKKVLTQVYDRGGLSKRTYIELVPEVDFETEVYRRKQEARDGVDNDLYPHETRNMGQYNKVNDFESPKKDFDKNGNIISDEKTNVVDKENFKQASLEIAPYKSIDDLDIKIKNNMTKSLQRIFMNTFNKALEHYGNETTAFRVAWSAIRKLSQKNSKGIWVRIKKSSLDMAKLIEDIIED